MQIPIINGIYSDEDADFRISYPFNMMPIAQQNGISSGYLRPAHGVVLYDVGPGKDRAAINWNNVCFRVMGTKLISINSSGVYTELASLPGIEQATFDYSFDRLAIAVEGNLYYWDNTSLVQVTDSNLGTVLDMIWVDGYFMTTDGEFIVVTDLNNPTVVKSDRYGSSEADPDPIVALLKLRNEPYALNRYTIEVFQNIGGTGFPFQRIEGAQLQRGTIGTHSCIVFMEAIAFLGGARNESPSVWLGLGGKTIKLATREIDQILQEYSENDLSKVVFETQVQKGVEQLYIRLKDKTLLYDAEASKKLNHPVWCILASGNDVDKPNSHRITNRVWVNDRWVVGDTQTGNYGYLVDNISSQWGEEVAWEFGTTIIYNESRGAIFNEIELVGLPGRVALGDDERIFTSYSTDGETWSQEKGISAGKVGERDKRLTWFKQGIMSNYRMQKFRGSSKVHASFARLEVRIEPLAV